MVFSPDRDHLATRSRDGTTFLIETEIGDQLAILLHKNKVWEVDFSPDGSLLATSSRNKSGGTVSLFETESGEELAHFPHDFRCQLPGL